jgi:hypothetical protein
MIESDEFTVELLKAIDQLEILCNPESNTKGQKLVKFMMTLNHLDRLKESERKQLFHDHTPQQAYDLGMIDLDGELFFEYIYDYGSPNINLEVYENYIFPYFQGCPDSYTDLPLVKFLSVLLADLKAQTVEDLNSANRENLKFLMRLFMLRDYFKKVKGPNFFLLDELPEPYDLVKVMTGLDVEMPRMDELYKRYSEGYVNLRNEPISLFEFGLIFDDPFKALQVWENLVREEEQFDTELWQMILNETKRDPGYYTAAYHLATLQSLTLANFQQATKKYGLALTSLNYQLYNEGKQLEPDQIHVLLNSPSSLYCICLERVGGLFRSGKLDSQTKSILPLEINAELENTMSLKS